MSKGNAILSKKRRQLVFILNDLCFGEHGQLSALLKDFHYFLYFKKHKDETLANVYLQRLFFYLKNIVMLTRLIEEFGGCPRIPEYNNNRVDYYKLKSTVKVVEKIAVFDSIATQMLVLENYIRAKAVIDTEKVKLILDGEIENIKSGIDFLVDKYLRRCKNV